MHRFHPTPLGRPYFSRNAGSTGHDPIGCEDTGLAAFAQLGVTRIHAQRCMISLISSDTEYVLAESTQTLSLQYDTSDRHGDDLWMGTCAFPRNEGLNGVALRKWQNAKESREKPESAQHYYTEGQSPHWFIVSDVTCRQEYRNTPLVTDASQSPIRFFCSIPIRSFQGSVVGCLSVIDDKPRYGVSAREMDFMEDLAETIIKYLDANRSITQQQRSERLIQGLGLFNTGHGTLRDWWIKQDEATARTGRGRKAMSGLDNASRQERANDMFGPNNNPADFERTRERSVSATPSNSSTSMSSQKSYIEPSCRG